jgi:hypothetical protein
MEAHPLPPQAANQQATRAEKITARLEALKLVKEWSSGLVVVQSGAIAVIGAVFKTVPTGWSLALVIVLLVTLISSIYVGAVAVAGTVPYIVQSLPTNPDGDIYEQTGGMGGPALGSLCKLPKVAVKPLPSGMGI